MCLYTAMKKSYIFFALCGLLSLNCKAQFSEPVDSTQVIAVAGSNDLQSYIMPDVPKELLKWTKYEGSGFSYKIGFVPIVDYTGFLQNQESKNQVGLQDNQLDLRSARVSAGGFFKLGTKIRYFFSLEYRGFDRPPESNGIGITDAYLEVPIGPKAGKIRFGKIKETFVYEMVGDAANLPQMERILNPFFNSRNIGVMYMNYAFHDRVTFAAGWYNNWFVDGQSFKESADTFSARITGLPIFKNDGSEFLHVGASLRYVQTEGGVFRYKGRNESNVTDYYIDTGNISSTQVWNMGLESQFTFDRFSILGEYVSSWCDVAGDSNIRFSGYYATGSYVFKGKQRPYDKKAAYARRIMPQEKGGSWEVVVRLSHLDFNDRNIEGGMLDKLHLGLNWWATQHWHFGVGYGLSQLDKTEILGVTNSLLTRLQWVY